MVFSKNCQLDIHMEKKPLPHPTHTHTHTINSRWAADLNEEKVKQKGFFLEENIFVTLEYTKIPQTGQKKQ